MSPQSAIRPALDGAQPSQGNPKWAGSAFRAPRSAFLKPQASSLKPSTRWLGALLPCCLLALASPALAEQPVLVKIEIFGGLSWPEQGIPHTYACGERYLRVISDGPGPGVVGPGTIEEDCTVRVFMDGAPDIDVTWTNVDYYGPGQFVDCEIQVYEGQPSGLYSVEVINPGGESAVLEDVLDVDGTCPRGRPGDMYVLSYNARNDARPGGDNVTIMPQRGWSTPCPGDDPDLWGCVCNNAGNIIQYDGQTGEFVCVFVGARTATWDLYDFVWGPNGNLFAVGLEQSSSYPGWGKVIEYDGQTGEFVRVFVHASSGGMMGPVSLAFGGPNANLYVLTMPGNTLSVYNKDSVMEFDGRTGAYIPHPGQGTEYVHHYGPLFHPERNYNMYHSRRIRFGPEGYLLLSSDSVCDDDEPGLAAFDPVTGELVRVLFSGEAGPFCFGHVGFVYEPMTNTVLMADTGQSAVNRYSFATGAKLETVIDVDPPFAPGDLKIAEDLAWGPNGNLYVVADSTLTALPNMECYSPTCSGENPLTIQLGAVHEFDGATYEQVRVFGYGHQWEDEWAQLPRPHELWHPCSISFKPLAGDWGGGTAGGDFKLDAWDYDRFVEAFNGGSNNRTNDLIAFDADGDGDVDCDDWPAFQQAWLDYGEGSPPDFPGCAGYDPDPDGDGVHFDDDVCPNTDPDVTTDAQGRPLGDLDGDCNVDLADFAIMQANFRGP